MKNSCLFLLLLCGGSLHAANPIYSTDYFPDPKPHLWSDGRVYVYPSHDITPKEFCSDNYHVISSRDLMEWKDLGVSLQIQDTGLKENVKLYACDAVFKDGLYHLYASTTSRNFVELSSPSPAGPFTHPHVMKIYGIDPGVLVDTDGQVYIYWGQVDQVRAAKLKPNLFELEPETVVQPLNVKDFGFHEGSSVIKRGDTYYYIYASTIRSRRPSCLAYATSQSPLGPFTYRGVIIDNAGCDPKVWNIHGRIFEFKGAWYVFYHRSTHGTEYMRQTCVEPITFNPDGSIPEVPMTSNGAGPRLLVTKEISATRACQLRGRAFLGEDKPEPELVLTSIYKGDAAIFRGLDFTGSVKTLSVRVRGGTANDQIEVREEDPAGALLGALTLTGVAAPGEWRTESGPLAVPDRVKNICFVFKPQTPESLAFASFHWK